MNIRIASVSHRERFAKSRDRDRDGEPAVLEPVSGDSRPFSLL